MKTILTYSADEAARLIKNGGVVAFPTETVYGLGANVFDETAIARIFRAKGRPNDNPLIAHVADFSQISALVSQISPAAEKFIAAFFPAPLTLVLPKSARVPLIATANLPTIGVRMPAHDLAREFIEFCETPIVAPSANLSGKPSPTTWQAVYEDLNSRIDAILQGSQTQIGLESTVVDCTGEIPIVLRAGAMTLDELQKIVPETIVSNKNSELNRRSPGTRYKHYAPRAQVVLINDFGAFGDLTAAAFIGLDAPPQNFRLQKICVSIEDYAYSLFAFFRICDARRIETIYCQIVAEKDLGTALMDRLRRASQ